MRQRTLTPVEEKVLRMRHGIAARGYTRLETWGDDNPVVAEQLARLEHRLLAAQRARAALEALPLRAVSPVGTCESGSEKIKNR